MFKYYFRLKYINDQCDGPHDLLRGAFNEDKYLCPENSVSWSNSLKYNCLKQWDFNPWKSSLSFSVKCGRILLGKYSNFGRLSIQEIH